MERENSFRLLVTTIKDSGKTIRLMDTEPSIYPKLGLLMWEFGRMTYNMVLGKSAGRIKLGIRELTSKDRSMARVTISSLMAPIIMAIFKIINFTAMVFSNASP